MTFIFHMGNRCLLATWILLSLCEFHKVLKMKTWETRASIIPHNSWHEPVFNSDPTCIQSDVIRRWAIPSLQLHQVPSFHYSAPKRISPGGATTNNFPVDSFLSWLHVICFWCCSVFASCVFHGFAFFSSEVVIFPAPRGQYNWPFDPICVRGGYTQWKWHWSHSHRMQPFPATPFFMEKLEARRKMSNPDRAFPLPLPHC